MRVSRRALLAASPLLLAAPRLSIGNELNDGKDFPEFTERSLKSIRRGTEWLKKTQFPASRLGTNDATLAKGD